MANYVKQDISQSFQNPKFGRIRGVLHRFDPAFASTLETKLPADGPEMKALRDINTVKQNVAHFGVYDLKLSLGDVEDYYYRVLPILEVLESILS